MITAIDANVVAAATTAICGPICAFSFRVAMLLAPTLFAPSTIHGALQHEREARGEQHTDSLGCCPARPTSAIIEFKQSCATPNKEVGYTENFAHVCANIVDFSNCDFLFGCDAGAIRTVLEDAGIDLKDFLRKPFGESACCAEVNSYMGMWNFGAAYNVTVSLHGNAEVIQISGPPDTDAVIARFDMQGHGEDNIHVVTGALIFVANRGPPSITHQRNAVRALRRHLERLAAPDGHSSLVRIILRDNKLAAQHVQEALQCGNDDVSAWTVVDNPVGRAGSGLAMCGTVARFVCTAICHSPEGRGERHEAGDTPAGNADSQADLRSAGRRKRKFCPGDSKTGSIPMVDSDAVDTRDAGNTAGMEDYIRRRARELHDQMKNAWDQSHEQHHSPHVREHLRRAIFRKRRSSQPAAEGVGSAFVSQEETMRAIASVLRIRHEFLRRKNIHDNHHVFANYERKELLKDVREAYWQTPRQRILEQRDVAAPEAAGWKQLPGQEGDDIESTRGAPPPTWQCRVQDTKDRRAFVRKQKLKRWHSHLQRWCGTRQIWAMLAFTGRFDVDRLEKSVRREANDATTTRSPRDEAAQQHRRQLHQARAEAVARFVEGERLARHRAKIRNRGACQPSGRPQASLLITRKQAELLYKFKNGELGKERNQVTRALGHNVPPAPVRGAGRLVEDWVMPDFREFLQEPQV